MDVVRLLLPDRDVTITADEARLLGMQLVGRPGDAAAAAGASLAASVSGGDEPVVLSPPLAAEVSAAVAALAEAGAQLSPALRELVRNA